MKKFSKILSLALVVVMAFAMFAACTDDTTEEGGTTFDITVWVSDVTGVKEQFETQIARFNATSEYTLNATVEAVGEGEAATTMITDVETGADIYCFAQDQLARLVSVNALAKLGVATSATITADNDASAVAAATVGDSIYCYPLTSDNGYFMIYDKSVIPEEDIDDLAAILEDCATAGKTFNMDLLGSGWYNASFFFGAGCVSSWVTDSSGSFTAVNDTYNSDAGLVAMKALNTVLNSSAFNSAQSADQFNKGGAVVITGTWDSATSKEALGDNYGVTDLPSFTVDGVSYHMGSFSGNKLLGIKPQSNATKAAALQALALYLSGEECQLERFTEFGWGPSNKNAQKSEKVQADATLTALAEQNAYAVPQGQIPNAWWDVTKTLAASAKAATTDEELQTALAKYDTQVKSMADGTYTPDTSIGADQWAVIGSMYGDSSWTVDHPMTETETTGVWKTNYPIYISATDEFKARKGGSWDESIGVDGGNCKAEAAGLYWVTLDVTNQTITLTEATFGVVGKIGGTEAWETDNAMTVQEDGSLLSAALTLAEGDAIKVRADGAWTLSYGDSEGNNYAITTAGTYQVKLTFNLTTLTWEVSLVAAE